MPLSLENGSDEKVLALTNGGINDDLNESQPEMKQIFPAPSSSINHTNSQNAPPRTAGSKVRPNRQK